jgi:oxygen-dependent protoporphyrinogen oxidase
VTLFEGSTRLGGQLHTERSGGFLIEHGAEGFVAGSAAVAALARALGIAAELREQGVSESCHFDGQSLVRLPPGAAGRMLGFQVGPRALGKGIQSFVHGMSQVVDALRSKVGPRVTWVQATPIRSVRPMGSRWTIVPREGPTHEVDRVVVATGGADAAALLAEAFGPPAAALAASEALSSVTVSLAYPRADVAHALDATGFVVAEGAQVEGFRACTFASSKFAGRAPTTHALLRSFFRPTAEDLASLSDVEWAARADRRLRTALELVGAGERSWVSRWPHALPVFDVAHKQRIHALESVLAGSGVSVAGACFHGSGIDGAVRSAEAAAMALD